MHDEDLVTDRADQLADLPEVVDGVQEDGTIVRTELSAEERTRLFDEQVVPFLDRLYGAAVRYTRDPVAAEDLLQEAMAKAYSAFHQYQQGTNLKAWLYRILHNTYISQYRKKQRRPQEDLHDELEDFSLYKAVGGAARSAEADVFAAITDDEVKQALADLPDTFRMAVFLADVEGFPYKDIAEIMDTPIGTVMSRLHRGRKALQKSLADYAARRGLLADGDTLDDGADRGKEA
jgi:RNA polymerase sigma-70 factor (ECF subfamily)